ncbi:MULTISPECIES: hypothetical protein [unclassified Methylophaga]|uniref:hypothetical protein n=1 Tax=unclassified Methylophaga TaxID=2629249 RepID=UPI000C8AB008|nr:MULTISPECIES: hypothetical protein [unclassified Methylophaga]MBN47227.1 hypothetical protein [Methylophaga sp.]|tara:strand:+ start:20164 stop:20355 length:192 start_codon:yes stop_codon:yes gene_type:complete
MNYHRRKVLKVGLVSLIGISLLNTKTFSFFKKDDIALKTIGKNSYLVDGWVISKNDLNKREFS